MLAKKLLLAMGVVLISIHVQCDEDEEVAAGVGGVVDDVVDVIPTAVATVYEEKENVVTINASASDPPNSTASSTDEKQDVTAKPVKVQVACWDYRKIYSYPETIDDDEASNNDTVSNSVPPLEEEILAEPIVEEEEVSAAATEINESENDAVPSEETSSGSDVGVGDEVVGTAPPHPLGIVNKTVELVNVTYLMNDVLYQNPAVRSKSTPGNCTLVLFFTSWCPFCAKAAPHFNALPRAYPPLRVVAIDVQKQKTVSTYFGILGVPTVVLFQNGKLIAKFNDSQFTLNKFSEFIEYFTDLKHEERMNVTAKDFEGPLPSLPERAKDLYLLLAWIFLLVTCARYITKSAIWWRFVEFVSATWREAELQAHEHAD